MSDVLEGFAPATREWFTGAFGEPTPAQDGAWRGAAGGGHLLVVAPTGSGKTLAAFLASIDALMNEKEPREKGTSVLYVSPLKALAVDVERNLRSPLVGITQAAARRGDAYQAVTVGVRSGDTTQQERRRLASSPPDVLITTPESLFLMLTSAARETLRTVRTVIVDEVHAVAGTKRGAHLALSMERLDDLLEKPAQRIGLSATVRPHEEVARYLGGRAPVTIVSPPSSKRLDLRVVVPVDDMTKLGGPARDGAGEGSGARSIEPHDPDEGRASIWPHVEQDVLDRVLAVRSSIVFVNSRGLAERLTSRLNEAYAERLGLESPEKTGEPAIIAGASGQAKGSNEVAPTLARAHHGSVSKEQRELIENDLKTGELRCVVATSSLELGIDMGSVDLVVQVSSPPSVANGLQRVGRAGHQVGEVSRGLVYPTHRQDLVGAAVTTQRMEAGLIEALSVPANPLDVLAQQTVAACALEPLEVEAWFDVVRRAAPFAALPRSAYEATLDLVSGRYPSDAFAELRPRAVWDRDAGVLTGRPGAQRLAVTSGGTIPDRGLFTVVLPEDPENAGARRVGELDEEMVYESRVNDVITLGSTSWRIQEITHDRVVVTPAPGLPARLPFWKGDTVGRSFELGEAIGGFVREVSSSPRSTKPFGHLDDRAVANLRTFVKEQADATGHVPTDRTLVVERFRDELGDWRVVLHSPFGRRVHAPWALAVGARIQERYGIDGSVVAGDDGIVCRIPDTEAEPPGGELFVFEKDELERLVTDEVGGSALFAARFRECAARALLLPRRNPGARAPLWQQRQRASQLLDVARTFPTFPILLETARECLQDVYDLPALMDLTARIDSRAVSIAEVTTEKASPFASTMLFGYVAAFLYEGDTPLAERRAAALAIDTAMLSELLGRAELRELLDPEVLARTEAELQHLADDRRVKDAEGVADLVRRLGALSADEVAERSTDPSSAPAWLKELQDARRVIEVPVAGTLRWAAVEDAGRLRDALGVVVPLGVADAFLEPVDDPLGDLVSRFGRHRGPFTTADVAARFGLGAAVAGDVLKRLARDGRLTEGEFRPGASGAEWVDPGVLRRLRSRSLAAARQQVEPVETSTFARFLPEWQGVGARARGLDGVLGVVDQLAGVALPASAWESLVLPARVDRYTPALLDELIAAGEVVWSGAGSLPGSDGWVQLHPADLVLPTVIGGDDLDDRQRVLLDVLSGGGAHLFAQLVAAVQADEAAGGGEDDHQTSVADALWRLVWSGRVSNDSFAPLRTHVGGSGAHRTVRRAPRVRTHGRRPRPTPARRNAPPTVSGRWFALDEPDASTLTQDQLLRAETLLGRYGVVTRGSVMSEQVPGGFAAMYRVLREMEESGNALRGYFVETLGAAQFAASGTVDRLRSFARDDEASVPDVPAFVLAATDPANPYGAALPWPSLGDDEVKHRPARKAGSMVVVHDGSLVMYVERGGKKVLLHDTRPERLAAAAEALAGAVRSRRLGRLTVETVNDAPVSTSPLADPLREAGFERLPRGLRIDARG